MPNIYPTLPERLDFAFEDKSPNVSIDPLRKGSTFLRSITVTGIDLNGHRARMSVRESYGTPAILFFDSDEIDPNSERIELVGGQDFSVINMICPTIVSESLDAGDASCVPRSKKYKYDMEIITPTGEVYAFLEGDFFVVDELTTEF